MTDTDACGTIKIKKDDSDVPVKTYDAATGEQVTVTANANEGYAFLGWYRTIDGQLQLVSQKQTYTYTVGKQGVQTVYARFAQTYTITYTWDASNSPTDQTIPETGTATAGMTYPLPQTFVKGQTTCPGSKNGIPGNWVFQGWEKDGQGEALGAEIANVQEDMHLVGSWDFIPNAQYDLSYSMGDTEHCWIPSGGLGSIPSSEHFAGATVTSAAAPKIPEAENTILVANGTTFQGTWTFQGWKRSDTGGTAETSFSMPNHLMTLTAQWEFTPNVYTVQYNLNGGTGTVPEAHTSYAYTELNGKDGAKTPSGIPFGAILTVQNFTGTAPKGQYFAGWGLQRDATALYEPGQRVNNESLEVKNSGDTITLYAIYKDIGTVTVEFAGNDATRGSVSVRQGSFSERNGTLSGNTVKSEATAKPGYHFTGWTCETSGHTTSTETLCEVTANQVQTLFTAPPEQRVFRFTAQFEPNQFTVQFEKNADNVTGNMASQTFKYAGTGNVSLNQNAFVRPGYRFLGWSETSGKQGVVYADQAKFQGVTYYKGTEIKNNDIITLYAQWEKLPEITIDYTPFPEDLGTVTLNPAEGPSKEALSPQSIYTVSETGSPDHHVRGATAKPKDGCTF